jgi:hypothetical protein
VPAGLAAKDIPWLFGFAFRQVARTADRARPPVLDSSPVPVSRR